MLSRKLVTHIVTSYSPRWRPSTLAHTRQTFGYEHACVSSAGVFRFAFPPPCLAVRIALFRTTEVSLTDLFRLFRSYFSTPTPARSFFEGPHRPPPPAEIVSVECHIVDSASDFRFVECCRSVGCCKSQARRCFEGPRASSRPDLLGHRPGIRGFPPSTSPCKGRVLVPSHRQKT